MASDPANPLSAATQGIRDAAKYLIAAYGAIGTVLVAGLSLTALPSGAHPVLAALAVGVAVAALALLVGMGVSVLTPEAITLGGLAELEKQDRPGSSVVKRLKTDEALFGGHDSDLGAFHRTYVLALKDRAEKQEEFLREPNSTTKLARDVADSRARFLNEAVSQMLDVAVLYQLQDRFSPRRRGAMTLLALVVVLGAGVFASASAKPDAPSVGRQRQSHSQSAERIWLEHLVATSGYRIERLKQEVEATSSVRVWNRIDRALDLQTQVQRRERDAIRGLAAKGAG